MKQTYIIAEAGVNHNGSLDMAKKMVEIAAKSGANAIKFQTFQAEKLVSKSAPKASYQQRTTGETESQYEMIKKLELDEHAHLELIEACRINQIDFVSTPFDSESVHLLGRKLNIPCIKIPSGEITNGPLMLEVARCRKKIILSTGMCGLADIETALGVLAFGLLDKEGVPSKSGFVKAFYSDEGQALLRQFVTILHCTTEYPAPVNEVNLKVLATLHNAFGLPAGLSDHTEGWNIPVAAVALGASMIEKHFTLDRSLPGPDHAASLEPEELEAMIKGIRQVEQALGRSQKIPTPSESKNIHIARKSLVAARAIKKGECFTLENLTAKRPGNGVSPMEYWDWIGREAEKDYETDEMIP